MPTLWLELLKIAGTLIGVSIGAWVALRMYFRQKEYELVKQRYLEGAVDILAAELEQTLGIVSHNWTRCIWILRSLRDAKEDFDIKELERGFMPLDTSQFHKTAHFRVQNLTNSIAIWQAYQLAMAYAAIENSLLTEEIPQAIRLRKQLQREPEELASSLFARIQEVNSKGERFAKLVHALHALGRILEVERFNFKTIGKFAEREEVKQLVAKVGRDFPPENAGASSAA